MAGRHAKSVGGAARKMANLDGRIGTDARIMGRINDSFAGKSDRRWFLRGLAGAAGFAAAGVAARRAAAATPGSDPLFGLMGEGQREEFGQTFDQASRTIHMPKPTAPTLSPQTAEITEKAVATYDDIVARGGWP
jgi:L,D-transpeptidase YcbB